MTSPIITEILNQNSPFVQRALDSMDDPIFVKDREHRWVVFNQAFCTLIGQSSKDMLGKSDPDFFPPDQAAEFWKHDDLVFESGESIDNEEQLTDDSGTVHTLWTRKYPIRDAGGQLIALTGIITDITELRHRIESVDALEKNAAEKLARFAAQQELIDSMEAPVIALWEGVLLVPIVGELSERRAQVVLERLLAAIAQESTRVVFLDISGVPSLTASSAATLRSAVSTTRLLGAQAEIVGIRPAIAQVLVERGIDLGAVRTHSTLRDGLRAALLRMGHLSA